MIAKINGVFYGPSLKQANVVAGAGNHNVQGTITLAAVGGPPAGRVSGSGNITIVTPKNQMQPNGWSPVTVELFAIPITGGPVRQQVTAQPNVNMMMGTGTWPNTIMNVPAGQYNMLVILELSGGGPPASTQLLGGGWTTAAAQ